MLQGPNNGYDENDRWLGMTRDELKVWRQEGRREHERMVAKWRFEKWEPSGPAS